MTAPYARPDGSDTRGVVARGRAATAAAVVALSGLLLTSPMARAQVGSDRYSSIVIEAGSGHVLEAENRTRSATPPA